ncbi:putative protein kinase RLK-Pelle-LRR-I-1 family [Helianthus annuus]|nr:putative protein kinase RLK-Pelle-LRR-I-1 family [Helianthus annuus]
MVYNAELDYFDRNGMLTIGEDTGEVRNKKVLIYRSDVRLATPKEAFFAEIKMLINCKHPNVLSFFGFCDEDSEMILVFEGAFKGTLNDYLKQKSYLNEHRFFWMDRIHICLDVAHGLKYLQNREGKPMMIHHVIQSSNVFMDEMGTAKIAYFRLSNEYHTMGSMTESNYCKNMSLHRLDGEDIYFLGVILFQIIVGDVPDQFSIRSWAFSARQCFSEGTLMNRIGLYRGLDQDSFDTFAKIAYQCTEEDPSERPTCDVVIKSLEKALYFQHAMSLMLDLDHLRIPLKDIILATRNFDVNCCIGSGGYGEVYKAELKLTSKDEHLDTPNTVAIKRITSRKDDQGNEGFFAELNIVSKCEHPNIVSLLGFCVEDDEMLLVYELASNGSLEDYLGSNEMMVNLTWAKRLKMCIEIAQGLKYMHTTMDKKDRIIHRDIKSANILLGENLEAKIADFGLCKVHHGNQGVSTINTKTLAGTEFYVDPEYARTGRLKKASDIYSFGVVLFEIFSGKLAYDTYYTKKNERGLAPVARKHFKKGTIREILDPTLMDEAYELGFTGKLEPDHDSLDVFSRIAYECLAKTQVERPTLKDIIVELEKALYFQENRIKTLNFSLEHIRSGVEDFSSDNFIMRGGYGALYKGKVQYNNRDKQAVVKRFSHDRYLNDTSLSWEHGFLKEFEHASKGTLDRYLDDSSFSWTKRLKICIDIAKGLKFLHEGGVGQEVVIHRDLKSSNILLNKDYKAKICGFELALTYPSNQEIQYVKDNVEGSLGYSDPLFRETRFLTKESDIYSLGVILFEVFCGRLACPADFKDPNQFLDVLVKRHFQEAPLMDIVFSGIKDQIGSKSLATFRRVAFQCLLGKRKDRPIASDIVVQLQNALKFQVSFQHYKIIFVFMSAQCYTVEKSTTKIK